MMAVLACGQCDCHTCKLSSKLPASLPGERLACELGNAAAC